MTAQCAKCSAKQSAKQFFCSVCGFDIVTGTINSKETEGSAPETEPIQVNVEDNDLVSVSGLTTESAELSVGENQNAASGVETQVVYSPPSTSPVNIQVSYSKEFFERVVQNNEMLFPQNPLPIGSFEIVGDEIHIGRADPESGINPDIDINDLTADMAVSIQHAVIRVSANGVLSVTDLNSTNGTFMGSAFARPIKANDLVEFNPGTPIYLGAWTKIVVTV